MNYVSVHRKIVVASLEKTVKNVVALSLKARTKKNDLIYFEKHFDAPLLRKTSSCRRITSCGNKYKENV